MKTMGLQPRTSREIPLLCARGASTAVAASGFSGLRRRRRRWGRCASATEHPSPRYGLAAATSPCAGCFFDLGGNHLLLFHKMLDALRTMRIARDTEGSLGLARSQASDLWDASCSQAGRSFDWKPSPFCCSLKGNIDLNILGFSFPTIFGSTLLQGKNDVFMVHRSLNK